MLPHHRRRNGASAGLALLVWLAVAALLHAPGTPPVYDGIATPPEPYRWVSPPPSLACSNQAPLVGRATFAVPNVQFAGGLMLTGDNQVVLTFGPASLQAVAGSTSIACTIEPLARPPAGPAGA